MVGPESELYNSQSDEGLESGRLDQQNGMEKEDGKVMRGMHINLSNDQNRSPRCLPQSEN